MPGASPAQQDGATAPGEAADAERVPPRYETQPGEAPRAEAATADGTAPGAVSDAARPAAGRPAAPRAEHPAAAGESADVDGSADPDSSATEEDAEPDDGPRPLGLLVEPTGHAPVDAHLKRLEDADHLAVSGHLEVYEDVHRGLRDTLAALDRPAPGPAAAPRTPGHPHPGS
jgi:hypothetical protein